MSNPPTIQLRRLLWAGPLTVLAAIAGVLIVRILAVLILHPVRTPPSLGWVLPSLYTFILVTGAVLVYAVVMRFVKKNPLLVYQIIALVFLLISFYPDLRLALHPRPGTNSWPTAIALMIMHIVAGTVTVVLLPLLTAAPSSVTPQIQGNPNPAS
ncbi:MAG TPA: hypothetical protein VIN60_03150 [Anaerolineales bacterium]